VFQNKLYFIIMQFRFVCRAADISALSLSLDNISAVR